MKVFGTLPFHYLQMLDIGDNKITNQGLIHLAGLSKLLKLSLWRCEISSKGLKYLAKIQSLKFIDLSWNKVTNDGMRTLKEFKQL